MHEKVKALPIRLIKSVRLSRKSKDNTTKWTLKTAEFIPVKA
ncbi:hypothetical protein [Arcticibacter eurypsychrophilus]|nr:hypothetical protein [Arcticibacter eurypsychrophilus]